LTFYPTDLNTEFIQISDELFLRLGKMITERYGIKMPPDKKIMFQARLQKRLRELGIYSFEEYAEKLMGENGNSTEFTILADYISTNKTDFFREKEHFNFISDHILPEFLNQSPIAQLPKLKLWSAGCSSGQEAYSIAITIEQFMRLRGIRFDYSIIATDISAPMLKAVREAIYPISQVSEMPVDIKHRYFLKSKSIKESKVRVIKEVRDHVKLAYLNLMDNSFTFDTKFDVVFLRNTLIYFDSETQRKVLLKVLDNLTIGAHLFIGHSESLINMNLPIQSIAPSVYIKTNTNR
jgi:chemotaxis protein methyltransferase CheR